MLSTKFISSFQPTRPYVYCQALFNIKSVAVVGRSSTLVLGINKDTLEHVTLQSVLSTDREKLAKHLQDNKLTENEYFLVFKDKFVTDGDSPISWMEYENTLCYLDDYISLISYSSNSPATFFTDVSANGWLQKIYFEEAANFNFDVEVVSLNFISQLFAIVNYLGQRSLNRYFYLTNILVTSGGKLKLFPGSSDNKDYVRSKDAEDIMNNLDNNQNELLDKSDLREEFDSDKVTEREDYLRNMFVCGLISVRMIFRNWSPFRLKDLSETIIEQYGIVDEDSWLVRCVYEEDVHQNFISNSLKNSVPIENRMLQELIRFLLIVFQSRKLRAYEFLENSKYLDVSELRLDESKQIKNEKKLVNFLHNHLVSKLCENQHNQTEDDLECCPRKKKKSDNYEQSGSAYGVQDRETYSYNQGSSGAQIDVTSDELLKHEDCKGVDNWTEDYVQYLSTSKYLSSINCANNSDLSQSCQIVDPTSDDSTENRWGLLSSTRVNDNESIIEPSESFQIADNSLDLSVVPKEYQGMANWMADSISFIQPPPPGKCVGLATSTPKTASISSHSCSIFDSSSSESSVSFTWMPSEKEETGEHDHTLFNYVNLNFPITKTTENWISEVDDYNFMIYTTENNGSYLEGISDFAKSIKISIRETPKPIISCYENGICSMDFKLSETARLTLNAVPVKFLSKSFENSCN